MKLGTKALLAAFVALVTAGATAAPAGAITGGEPDGEGHPNVALTLFYSDGGRYRCSATLVAPDVLLTAAHCTDGTDGLTIFTFDTDPAVPPPADDPAAGYTEAPDGWYAGTAYTHPDYSDFTDMDSWNDVGVIVLDEPIEGIEPATIAPSGYLDDFAQPRLNKTIFTSVGYGTEVRKPESGPQKPQPMTFPLIRRVAEQPGQKLTPQLVQMNGTVNDTRGTGGTCFGDSGGPSFLDGYVVTVTSYGYTDNCRYLGGYQRVDIPVVQDWLATFGVVPAS